MTLADLYEEMKASLRFLDLRFHEMDKADVRVEGSNILVVHHEGRETRIGLPTKGNSK